MAELSRRSGGTSSVESVESVDPWIRGCRLSPPSTRASVLVGVLWCLALLAVVVVSVLHTATQDLRLARHQGDRTQAHYLALAGIEKAKAAISEDLRLRRKASRHHTGRLEDAPDLFREVTLGRGHFSILHPAPGAAAEAYGVADESGRLDLNSASTNELLRLPGMTLDVAAAILDWRDSDSVAGPGGAEADYYGSRTPPVLARNGPFQTLRELAMVRGVTRARLRGTDGMPAWETLLGLNARSPNVTAAGEDRVNIKTADERALSAVRGFTPEIARAIIAQRSRGEFNSILDLLNVTPAPAGGPGRNAGPGGLPPGFDAPGVPSGNRGQGGPRVISEDLLLEVADLITVGDADEAPGRININSAPADVLACLEGVDLPLAQSLVAHRTSIGGFSHPIALLRAPGMSLDKLRPILPRLTASSDTWRILAEGVVPDRGVRARIEVVVRIDTSTVTTLNHREDDL